MSEDRADVGGFEHAQGFVAGEISGSLGLGPLEMQYEELFADALADVVYVAYGSAVTYGIDLDAVVREVHHSNMSKLDAQGNPILRKDGKVLKSEQYRPPDVRKVIDEQPPLFHPDGTLTDGSTTRASAIG